jgi:hypothetical protein
MEVSMFYYLGGQSRVRSEQRIMLLKAEVKVRDRIPMLLGEGEVDSIVEALPTIEDTVAGIMNMTNLEITEVQIMFILKDKKRG